MSHTAFIFASRDAGLLSHWRKALGDTGDLAHVASFVDLLAAAKPAGAVIWLDSALPGLPAWGDAAWGNLRADYRIVFATTFPKEAEAVAALDAGCAAYAHAYASADTLQQIQQVVGAGHVWVGRELMQKLLAGVQQVAQQLAVARADWAIGLTEREQEVASLAANGLSNLDIAAQCGITERTVKAHLAAVFGKLQLTDRLQLALRVHGIR